MYIYIRRDWKIIPKVLEEQKSRFSIFIVKSRFRIKYFDSIYFRCKYFACLMIECMELESEIELEENFNNVSLLKFYKHFI